MNHPPLAQAGTLGQAQSPATQMDVICNHLSEVVAALVQEGDRLAILDQRVTGGNLSPASNGPQVNKPREVPAGLLAQIEAHLADIQNCLVRNDNHITRLSAAL